MAKPIYYLSSSKAFYYGSFYFGFSGSFINEDVEYESFCFIIGSFKEKETLIYVL